MNTRTLSYRKWCPARSPLPFQTPGEEIANSILHGVGSLLAFTGLVFLVLRAKGSLGGWGGGALGITACVIFTATLISMFLASTLYHAIQHEGAKRIFRILDHSAIYLLIAGTYTPFCLLALKGAMGWIFFGIEWALAVTGITLYAVNCTLLKKAELGVYILMGWAIVAGWFRLVSTVPVASLVLLASGGVAYTLGTIWYGKPNRRGTHVIWHVFVLIGAVCHWWSIWLMS
ncbi:MAG: hemolysin III family protein [Treponema sp.]|jgi:hemolysin III|nr:hemolysin III family protein [Treponema sp.]